MKMKNKGITLIALVITIIIMLILAGITINLVIGENGILKRAQEAGKNYQNAAKDEEERLAQLKNYIDNSRDIEATQEDYQELVENLERTRAELATVTNNLNIMTERYNTLLASERSLNGIVGVCTSFAFQDSIVATATDFGDMYATRAVNSEFISIEDDYWVVQKEGDYGISYFGLSNNSWNYNGYINDEDYINCGDIEGEIVIHCKVGDKISVWCDESTYNNVVHLQVRFIQ